MNFKIELEIYLFWENDYHRSYLSLNKPFQIYSESNEKETLIFIS